MKKYFTAYLPTEGEIKEGDMTIGVRGHIAPAITPKDYNNIYVPYWDGRKLVKLFLCSRDIKHGDKYHDYAGSPVFTHDEDDPMLDKDCFKIIGEISPNATWVKEGDEFDEEDLDKMSLEGIKSGYDMSKRVIQIKCLICGAFH